jgi:hypothetical protein
MTDCPRPTCYALRSVDSEGYCNACGKMVPKEVPVKIQIAPR